MFLTQDEIIETLNKVIDLFLIPRYMENGMIASAEWIAEIQATAGLNEGSIIAPPYTKQLALGREPGTMPPVEPLIRWVEIKLNIWGDQATSIAWAIAKKIQARGTTYYEEGGTDLLEVLDEPRTLQFIQEELGMKASIKIQEELIRNAEKAFS